jgi:hypothetical protein
MPPFGNANPRICHHKFKDITLYARMLTDRSPQVAAHRQRTLAALAAAGARAHEPVETRVSRRDLTGEHTTGIHPIIFTESHAEPGRGHEPTRARVRSCRPSMSPCHPDKSKGINAARNARARHLTGCHP